MADTDFGMTSIFWGLFRVKFKERSIQNHSKLDSSACRTCYDQYWLNTTVQIWEERSAQKAVAAHLYLPAGPDAGSRWSQERPVQAVCSKEWRRLIIRHLEQRLPPRWAPVFVDAAFHFSAQTRSDLAILTVWNWPFSRTSSLSGRTERCHSSTFLLNLI